jgi:HSP20 family molecular chaperone IbpA
MAKEQVGIRKSDSILEELNALKERISQRAYEFFRNPDDFWSGPVGDWLRAERELVWRPAIELRQKGNVLELAAALAGVDPKDLDVQVTPEDILIKASSQHEHTSDEGTVHLCEFDRGRLFRSVRLPERIDPDSVKAEYRNGLLRLTAKVAKAETKKVEIQAA